MIYKVIGLMSGSSLDGLDIAYVHLSESAGKWNHELQQTACYNYNTTWKESLRSAKDMNAYDYQLLHASYGHYLGKQVNRFMEDNNLRHQVALIASHGHTIFHCPQLKMTSQLGDGSAIAAETGLPVISDLRSLDIAFGGQGAPIVPMGEKLLFGEYTLLLNLGGIANISCKNNDGYIAFDICPANAILNQLASQMGFDYDEGGKLASGGEISEPLLAELNSLEFYNKQYPKSLDNSFGRDQVFPIIQKYAPDIHGALRTYVEHICLQIRKALLLLRTITPSTSTENKILVTGGGAFNTFLLQRMRALLAEDNIVIEIPDAPVVKFKEALIMALLGVLRWREENTVLSSVTGASKNTIGGALWLGTDA